MGHADSHSLDSRFPRSKYIGKDKIKHLLDPVDEKEPEEKEFTVKVTYWINTTAKTRKEAKEDVIKNFTNQTIQHCKIEVLKHLKEPRYNEKDFETIPLTKYLEEHS